MVEIESISLSNVLYFKSVETSLVENNLTFVRGRNLDADPGNPTGNGAGKSSLLSTIPTIAFAAPPTVQKKRGGKKEVLSKKSRQSMVIKAEDGHRYRIEQGLSKYTIFKQVKKKGKKPDWVDLQVRTTPLAEKMIRKLFPLDELEFYTYCYVSSQRPSPFQSDTDINRLNHLSQMFKLDKYDDLKSYFQNKLKTIAKNKAKLQVLEASRLNLKAKAESAESQLDTKAVDRAKTRHEALTKELEVLTKQEFELSALISKLNTLASIEKSLDKLRKEYKAKEHPKVLLGMLKEQRSLISKYERYTESLAEYNKSVDKIKAKIKALSARSEDLDTLLIERTDLEYKKAQVGQAIKELETYASEVKDLESELVRIKVFLEDSGVPKKEFKAIRSTDYRSQLETCKTTIRLKPLLERHKHEPNNSNCPTCLSPLNLERIRSAVKAAEKQIPYLTKRIQCQKAIARQEEVQAELDGRLAKQFGEAGRAKLRKAKVRYSSLESQITDLDLDIEKNKRRSELEAALKSIEKPKKVDTPGTEMSVAEADSLIDLCTEILKNLEAKAKLLENNEDLVSCKTVKSVLRKLDTTKEDLESVSKSISVKRTKCGELASFLDKMLTRKSEIDLYRAELKQVEKDIKALKPSIEDEKILEALVRAYSNKGLKANAANEICGLLESNLNHHRHLILAEPFTFIVSASETGVSIKVDRGNGMVSDVRTLSGSESDGFKLLWMLSTLCLVPNSRRLNLCILDEPDSHMDDVSKAKFRDVFLPVLREIIPHVFVITQKSDFYLEGSKTWYVTKEKGVSSLVKV
jgi:DNA repair exonuclease SbcCD ATPase subunit